MKRQVFVFCLFACLLATPFTAHAQYKFGYLNYKALLTSMPEYVEGQKSLQEIRQKYEAETKHNEEVFNKMYADYLQGQKDFPQTIMLKRQSELQSEMEKGIKFRDEVKRLLQKAEADLTAPAKELLDSAIVWVGNEKGYEYILNTENNSYPFIHSGAGENATQYVLERLKALRHE